MSNPKSVKIVGAGLAGSEAALWLAARGYLVDLYEMRPLQMTEAHQTPHCAELVCSNSFKSQNPISAPGILKAEMTELGSQILSLAQHAQVPSGEALAVDREIFSKAVTQKILENPKIHFTAHVVNGEDIRRWREEDHLVLISTGPLTSPKLTTWLQTQTGVTDLYFYDAIAPIVDTTSLDREKIFLANRYDKGEEKAYLNCPLDRVQYEAFIDALLQAETVPPKNFEKEILFQGCQPIESIARSGRESLRFGPMKPVGLTDPKTGRWPYAAVQLRPENHALTAYNLVGFQTKLKYGEQGRIFRMIPGLERAEFLRMGSIHRNTYVCGPRVLDSRLALRSDNGVFLAGQVTGVEGYLESAACGLLAALAIHERLQESQISLRPPKGTALHALLRYITESDPDHYQPQNANFSIFDPADYEGSEGLKKDALRSLMATQSLHHLKEWIVNVP
jgi:methylenetetrahydrofolate--tRNA-(uracil-5-)-methyltransferase